MFGNKNKRRRPTVGLALGGGSALGLAHIGVIKALREKRIPIDFVSGTSAGAVAATALAFEVPLEKMIELTKELSWGNMSTFGYSKMGLNSNKPVGELMKKMIGEEKIENAYIPLAIVATDIDRGEKIIFRKGEAAEAVMASSCLPGYYVPVEIGRKKLVDGCLVENLPISPLEKFRADIKIGVNLERWKKCRKTKNVLDVIVNSYITLIKPQCVTDSQKADVMIEPHLELFSPSDFKKSDQLIEKGYEAAMLKIEEIKALLKRKEELSLLKKFFRRLLKFFK